MTIAPTAVDVLWLHPKIGLAGLATEHGEVVWMQQKVGIRSFWVHRSFGNCGLPP